MKARPRAAAVVTPVSNTFDGLPISESTDHCSDTGVETTPIESNILGNCKGNLGNNKGKRKPVKAR